MNVIYVTLCIVLLGLSVGVVGLLRLLDRMDQREEQAYFVEAPTYIINLNGGEPFVARACREEVSSPPSPTVPNGK